MADRSFIQVIAPDIPDAIAKGIFTGLAENISKSIEALGVGLQNKQEANKLVEQANRNLALNMRESVLRSYDQTVTRQKTVASYREGSRYAGGRLRRALEDESNYVATAEGISFIDIDFMSTQAKQWYRLNFGAGGEGAARGRKPGSYPLRLAGVGLGSLSLSSFPASGEVFMPSGFWLEGGFYPTSRNVRFTARRGIAARQFLDAGLARYAKDFNDEMSNLLITFRDQALRPGRGYGPLAETNVKARSLGPF